VDGSWDVGRVRTWRGNWVLPRPSWWHRWPRRFPAHLHRRTSERIGAGVGGCSKLAMDRYQASLNRKRRGQCSRRWQIMSDYSASCGA